MLYTLKVLVEPEHAPVAETKSKTGIVGSERMEILFGALLPQVFTATTDKVAGAATVVDVNELPKATVILLVP